MIGFFSVILGLIIVWLSYKVLVKEVGKGFEAFSEKYPGINDSNTKVILDQFDKMENLVNDLNSTYYDIVSQLEGHYSVHDKELQLLEGRLDKTESELRTLKHALSNEVKSRQKPVQVQSQASVTEAGSPGTAGAARRRPLEVSTHEQAAQETLTEAQQPEVSIGTRYNRKLDLLSLSDQEKETLRHQIIDMRHRGLNLAQIARELDVGVGELQLFLNLNKIR